MSNIEHISLGQHIHIHIKLHLCTKMIFILQIISQIISLGQHIQDGAECCWTCVRCREEQFLYNEVKLSLSFSVVLSLSFAFKLSLSFLFILSLSFSFILLLSFAVMLSLLLSLASNNFHFPWEMMSIKESFTFLERGRQVEWGILNAI